MPATVSSVPQNYAIGRWGEGYFGINARGHATVRPAPDQDAEIDLYELAGRLAASGLRLPVLVRFNDILGDRVRSLCTAFATAARRLEYGGGYRAVYPIKVNQQRGVVEQIVAAGDCVGLEAGSKPELMAVLASAAPGGVVVCNGYKDREYVRLALIGQRLGQRVYIVVEKAGEVELVLTEAADLGIEPRLGVRVRLAAIAAGNWQNSGGEKSKFGLSAAQVLALVERLRGAGKLHWLQLLHSHIGSQIPDLKDIRHGVGEAARYFAELRRLGAPLDVIDVGGGLGVDYEGSRSEHYCSINYDLATYADEVLRPIARVCDEQGLPQPVVFSESGRALTAHHALLITDVIEREPRGAVGFDPGGGADDDLLERLAAVLARVGDGGPVQDFQHARLLLAEVGERFAAGAMGLVARARAESLFHTIAQRVRGALRLESRRHRELLEELDELLADRVFGNFSLFQSLPDVWAIQQIFPVMPLHRLDETPDRAALLHDLTCDSDGRVGSYVDQDGVESTLVLHPPRAGEPYLLGIFLVGAYQEILGDMHNLFGDTDAVNVVLEPNGGYRLVGAERGDAVDELLRYVHYDPEAMLETFRRKLHSQAGDAAWMESHYRELEAGLYGYSYLGNR